MKRVLIVDDSLELGRWLQTALTQMDSQIQATVYPSGEEALLDSSRRPVDVLVTDIRLAGISGLELVRKIRKRYPGVRVIVITGMQDMSLEKQAKELGIDAFFRKPMDIPSFLEAVNVCLRVETGLAAPPGPVQTPAPPSQPPAAQNVIREVPGIPPGSYPNADHDADINEKSQGGGMAQVHGGRVRSWFYGIEIFVEDSREAGAVFFPVPGGWVILQALNPVTVEFVDDGVDAIAFEPAVA